MAKNKISRRKFIGTTGCAALGTTTLFSTLLNLKSMSAYAANSSYKSIIAPPDDYKALVCIMFGGGIDSHNMLVPKGDAEHAEYSVTRSNLAIAQDSLLDLNAATYTEKTLGLHPSMTHLKEVFDNGKLAFVNNVGTLVEPTTKAAYEAGGVSVPVGLYSHADQMMHWQTSVPQTRGSAGWGGRLADVMQSFNENQDISMSISLSGKNIFQAGNQTSEYTIRPEGTGSIGMNGYGEEGSFYELRTTAVNSLLEQQYQDVFKRSYAGVIKNAQATHEVFSAAISSISLSSVFTADNPLAQSLQMVAKTIAAREMLGLQRQTFFINFDGWDHHDEVLMAQEYMLGLVSQAMAEFQTALAELGIEDSVTTFTASDFGRTLTSNGNGTDHAWAGNMMVMGGAVNGGDMYGEYPSLDLASDLVVDEAALIPTLSTDEYFAELALWYGVAPSDLALVFPNIGNFYSYSADNMPIGFMNMA